MSAAPEGIAYFSKKGMQTSEFDPYKLESFYGHLLLDISLNDRGDDVRPRDWNHPRANEWGEKMPYHTIYAMYGRNSKSINRVRKVY